MASVETGVEHRGRDKRRARGRRKIRRIFGEKSAIFAASPLLLLVVGFLSRFQPTVLQARAEIIDDNNDGAGGRFGYWRTSGRVDSTGRRLVMYLLYTAAPSGRNMRNRNIFHLEVTFERRKILRKARLLPDADICAIRNGPGEESSHERVLYPLYLPLALVRR